MAQLGYTFDPSQVKEDDLLPKGEYVAQIIDGAVRAARSGNGDNLTLTWEVLDGPQVRRRFWQDINNIRHNNPQAQEIASRELKKITGALGLGPISATDPMHFKPLSVTVDIDPGDGNFKPRNVVKSVRSLNGQQATQQSGGGHSPPPPQQQAAGGGRMPWQN